MKKLILLTFLLSPIFINAQQQSHRKQLNGLAVHGYNHSTNQFNDTSLFRQFEWSKGKPIKVVEISKTHNDTITYSGFFYNNKLNHDLASEDIIFGWSYQTMEKHDGSGNLTKETYEYDGGGTVVKTEYSTFSNNAWTPYRKEETLYDEKGNYGGVMKYDRWNNDWKLSSGSFKYLNVYGQSGVLENSKIASYIMEWDTTNETRYGYSADNTLKYYVNDGDSIIYTWHTYNNSYPQWPWNYNIRHNLIKTQTECRYNDFLKQYDTLERYTFTYDENGRTTSRLYEVYDSFEKLFKKRNGLNIDYYYNGDMRSYAEYAYTRFGEKFLRGIYSYDNKYDSDGDITEKIMYVDSVLWSKTTYSYNNAYSIADPKKDDSLTIYPNPARNVLNVAIPAESRSYSISIAYLTGKTVLTEELSNSRSVDISSLSAGTYIVTLENEGRKEFSKLIKH